MTLCDVNDCKSIGRIELTRLSQPTILVPVVEDLVRDIAATATRKNPDWH